MSTATVKSVDTNTDGWIEVVADLPGHADHRILLLPDAVASRMLMYDLATTEEAFEAIIREHAVRLGELELPAGAEGAHVHGGLHPDVTVKHATGGKAKRDAVLARTIDVIDEAHRARGGAGVAKNGRRRDPAA